MPNSKPNDKSVNIKRMRDIVHNTERNLVKAEISQEFADPTQYKMINENNDRRRQSIEELKEEIRDDMTNIKKGKHK